MGSFKSICNMYQLIQRASVNLCLFLSLWNNFAHPFYLKQVVGKRTHQYSTDSQVDLKDQPINLPFPPPNWGPLQWKENSSKPQTGTSDSEYNLKSLYWGNWEAQSVKRLPSTQVMKLGSWDQVRCPAPCSAGSLLFPLPLILPSPQINK